MLLAAVDGIHSAILNLQPDYLLVAHGDPVPQLENTTPYGIYHALVIKVVREDQVAPAYLWPLVRYYLCPCDVAYANEAQENPSWGCRCRPPSLIVLRSTV